jgi:hypothetical protein
MNPAATNSFIAKLRSVVPLSGENQAALDALCRTAGRRPPRTDIVRKGNGRATCTSS